MNAQFYGVATKSMSSSFTFHYQAELVFNATPFFFGMTFHFANYLVCSCVGGVAFFRCTTQALLLDVLHQALKSLFVPHRTKKKL